MSEQESNVSGRHSLFKSCSVCKLPKPLSEFHKNRNRPDGYRCTCKACRKLETEQQKQNSNSRRRDRRKTDPTYRAKENQRTRKYNPQAATRQRTQIRQFADNYVIRAFIRGTDLKPADIRPYPELIELQRTVMVINRNLKKNENKKSS